MGVDVSRYRPETTLYARRMGALQGVDVVVDVGANTGQYGRVVRAEGYRGRIISFEPLSQPYAVLASRAVGDPRWDCRRLALGSSDEEAELNISANVQSSSLRAMNEPHVRAAPESRYVGVERVSVRRLDGLADALFSRAAVLALKLDVQGHELDVLRGGEGTLSQVRAIECELSLVPLYEGQALFSEVVTFLDERWFDLVALEPVLTDAATGKLLQLDGFFLRRR